MYGIYIALNNYDNKNNILPDTQKQNQINQQQSDMSMGK